MKEVLKPIFEFITGEFTLFDNIIYNYIAMGIIGLMALVIAFHFVGILYSNGAISGRGVGSIIHWVVRLVVFVVIFSVACLGVWLIKFIAKIPWWFWIFFAAIIASIIASIIIFLVRWKKRKREVICQQQEEENAESR